LISFRTRRRKKKSKSRVEKYEEEGLTPRERENLRKMERGNKKEDEDIDAKINRGIVHALDAGMWVRIQAPVFWV
jgi:hypothetical protein